MKRNLILVILSILVLNACSSSSYQERSDSIYQVSILDALMMGVYDGNTSFKKLKTFGDFGLGTFNALDGEMVFVDGQFYRITSDGIAHRVQDTSRTPFSVVTHFSADTSFTLESISKTELFEIIDKSLTSPNIPVAIKISGDFASIRTRSVPRQSKPYPLLSEVLINQPEFVFENTSGTLAGFRMPEYMENINAPGYHFHFITSDKSAGGHLLDFNALSLTVEMDYKQMIEVLIPADNTFRTVDLKNQTGDYH